LPANLIAMNKLNFLLLNCAAFALVAVTVITPGIAHADGGSADTMFLTDEPGNWFKSQTTGTPFTAINAGQRVDFKISNCCTSTRHTVTLLMKPTGSRVALDQDDSQNGTLSATFDVPGVYLFHCKVHPYMTAVVGVKNAAGQIPDVTSAMLPFIGHLGVNSLPATTVLSVITTIAPTDADKRAKWEILDASSQVRPAIPGVGEVWVDTQFERVPDQRDVSGVLKPGTITVVDAATFNVEREVNGRQSGGMWNNPHNMWANFTLDAVYNGNWFGKWINKIDRVTGSILTSATVGEAPTHIVTIPTPGSNMGVLTVPLSAESNMLKVQDSDGRLQIIDSRPTGNGRNHPHAQWLTCGKGDRTIVPNVFKGIGPAGSISILDTATGSILKEFTQNPNDPLTAPLLMPIAAGECHVNGVHKAYVANLVSGMVTVINVDTQMILRNIPVTLAPDGQTGLNIFHTLQGPIQTPVSPDGKYVVSANFLSTTITILDTKTDKVVKSLPCEPGCHGVNFGLKKGGGYYAYVASKFANVLEVVDMDKLDVVGRILLADPKDSQITANFGMGGQGVLPLPLAEPGMLAPTLALSGTGKLTPEVDGWLKLVTKEQRGS